MALKPGQSLVSEPETDHSFKNRRELLFSPTAGLSRTRSADPNFFQNVRDLATNTVFNFVDSALFGVPQQLIKKGATERTPEYFWQEGEQSYGEGFDALGIKPFEQLSSGGKFGFGLGQAAGFFVPFSGQAKLMNFAARATVGNVGRISAGIVDDVVRTTMKNGIKGTSSASALKSVIKNSIDDVSETVGRIYRATPDQYARFNTTLRSGIQKDILQFAEDNALKIGRKQADEIGEKITDGLIKSGQEGRFISDFGDVIGQVGVNFGNTRLTRNLAGYVGRTAEQSVNLFAYESIGHLVRAAAGAQYEDVDYDALESLKNSAGFSAIISFADFIPGGRKAGMFKDFYTMARTKLAKKRSFTEMLEKGKLNNEQLSTLTAWFGKQANFMKNGKVISDTKIMSMQPLEKAQWLDKIYSTAKSDLMRAIIKDGGRSLVNSLPRAAFDAVGTAMYMNGTENFMHAIHDESMAADYLVGAFMAMRAYQPLDPSGRNIMNKRMQYRYDTSIDSKLNMMRKMGVDAEGLKKQIPVMDQIMVDMNFSAKNIETAVEGSGLYEAVFTPRDKPDSDVSELTGMMAERDIADNLVKTLMPKYLNDNSVNFSDTPAAYLQEKFDDGSIPHVGKMSDEQFIKFWGEIKEFETSAGKTVEDYVGLGFERFREDFEKPIVNNHKGILIKHARTAAEALGIKLADGENGELRISDFGDYVNDDEVNFFLDRFRDLEKLGDVEIVQTGSGDVNSIRNNLRDPSKKSRLLEISEAYLDESARSFDSNYEHSKVDNPSITYMKEYGELVARNKMRDAITGNTRDGDDAGNSVKAAIESVLGHEVPVKGIEISKLDVDEKQIDNLSKYQKLIDDIYEMKSAVGMVKRTKESKTISFEDAKNLYNSLERSGVVSTDVDGNIMIGGVSSFALRSDINKSSMLNSNLDHGNWIIYSALRSTFGMKEGKVIVPSEKAFRDVITTELRNEAGERYSTKDIQDSIDREMKLYNEMLNDFSKSNLITETGSFNSDGFTAQEIGSFIRSIYDARAANNLKNIGEFFKQKSEISNKMINDYLTVKKKYKNNELSDQEFKAFLEKNISSIEEMLLPIIKSQKKDGKDVDLGDVVMDANDYLKDESAKFDTRPLMNRLFGSEASDSFALMTDLNRQITHLANIDKTSTGYSIGYAKLRSRMVDMWSNKNDQSNKMPMEEALFKFINERGYEDAKALIDQMQKGMNVVYDIDTNKIIGEASTKELMDAFDQLSSIHHRANSQSFIKRMGDFKVKGILDESGKKLSDSFINKMTNPDNYQQTISDLVDTIRLGMGDSEFKRNEEKLSKEIVSVISTLNRRNTTYDNVRLIGNTFVRNKNEKQVETPIGNFTVDLKSKGISLSIVKDEIVTENGSERLTTLDNLGSAQSLINSIFKNLDKDKLDQLQKGDDLFEIVIDSASEKPINPVFVPMQANSDIGVLVGRTEKNLAALKKEFYDFETRVMEEAPKGTAVSEHFTSIRNALESNSEIGIASAVRSMYYYDNVSKDMFWQMIGKDALSSKQGQLKNFKYIHHVNSQNAMSFDKTTLKMIDDAVTVMPNRFSKDAVKELKRRASNDEPIRVFVYQDEGIGPDGKKIKGTTAYDIIGSTVDKQIAKKGIVVDAKTRDKMILDTAREYNSDADLESLQQSITDGVSFGRKEAVDLDIMLMGEDFSNGSTAAKLQFHDSKKSFIGKTALRYDPTLNEFMKKNNIDYIVPASSAKSWENKANINSVKSWDNQESMGKNLIDNFDGNINDFSYKEFSSEAIKYMFPSHSGSTRANTTTSAMHFMDESALKAYSNQLEINKITEVVEAKIKDSYSKMMTSGIEGFFSKKYEESGEFFSHYSATEQLMRWGLDSQNGFVRDSVMRMVRDVTYGSLLAKPRKDVVNTFLFSDTTLDSAIYHRNEDGKTGHVKSYGQIRLPDSKKSVEVDRKTSFIFSKVEDGNFQDYVFNQNAEGANQLFTADRTKNVNGLKEANKKVFNVLSDYLYSSGNYGSANSKLENINSFLSGDASVYRDMTFEKGKIVLKIDKEMTAALKVLRDQGIRDFSIAVNSHKIPKKFASDSIVNRLEGFVSKEKGNVIEANNYEIALHHQADQDGDKMVGYMKMPFEVLTSSSDNMALAKEVKIVQPESVAFPNVFGSLNNEGAFTKDLSEGTQNNPLKYMQNERKSKFVVGSTVKMQGASTMFNIAQMDFMGKPIMKFNNALDGNFEQASDFSKAIGSITQSILDAWTGVHDSILSQKKIKDFLLFGDQSDIPVDKIPNTSGNPFIGIFAPDAGSSFADPNSPAGQVYRDYVREIYKTFEEVYSIFGDTYEGGVSVKPEYQNMKRAYYNMKSLFEGNQYYVFNKLMYKYENQKKFGNTSAGNKIKELRSKFLENPDSKKNFAVKSMFTFGKSFDQMKEIHPQLKALASVVEMGDPMRDKGVDLHENDYMSKVFNYKEDSIAFKMASVSEDGVISNIFDTNEGEVEKLIGSFKDKESLSSGNLSNKRNLGIFNYAIGQKIRQLRSEMSYYRKIGESDEADLIKSQIDDLANKKQEVNHSIFEIVQEGGQTASLSSTKFGYQNRNKHKVHLYKVNSSGKVPSYDFVGVLNEGQYAPRWTKNDKFVVLNNPIEIEPISNRKALEGHAMHLATDRYFDNVKSKNFYSDEVLTKGRAIIEGIKAELRQVNSDTFGAMEKTPAIKTDLFEHNEMFSSIIIKNMFDKFENESLFNEVDKTDLVRMILSPRAVANTVVNDNGKTINAFRVDKRFATSVFKYVNENKSSIDLDWFDGFETVFRDFGDKVAIANDTMPAGKNFVDDVGIFSRRNEYLSADGEEGTSMMKTLGRMSENNILIRSSMERFLPTDSKEDFNQNIKYNEFEKENETGCKI